jgi:hypothetical protein
MYYKEINHNGFPITDGYLAVASSKEHLDFYRLNISSKTSDYVFQHSFNTGEQLLSVANYCSQYFKKQWVIGSRVSFFESKEDLMLFKLRVQ